MHNPYIDRFALLFSDCSSMKDHTDRANLLLPDAGLKPVGCPLAHDSHWDNWLYFNASRDVYERIHT